MRLYTINGKYCVFQPEGIERALLRNPRLHQHIGVTRGSIYKWRWGHSTPSQDRAVLVQQHAPEAFAWLDGVTAPIAREPQPSPTVTVRSQHGKKPLPAKRLLLQIDKKAGDDGWARFSSCYGPAGLTAAEAKKLLAIMEANGGVEVKTVYTEQQGPNPTMVRIAEGARWLLQ